jgi:hypothetical protein
MIYDLKSTKLYPGLARIITYLDSSNRTLPLQAISLRNPESDWELEPVIFLSRTKEEIETAFKQSFIRPFKTGNGYLFKDNAYIRNEYVYIYPGYNMIISLLHKFKDSRIIFRASDGDLSKLDNWRSELNPSEIELLKENPYIGLIFLRTLLAYCEEEKEYIYPAYIDVNLNSERYLEDTPSNSKFDFSFLENLIDVNKIPVDLFRKELLNALSSQFPSYWFLACDKLGILEHFMPELTANKGCTQDQRYHTEDVFLHSLRAVDEARKFTIDPLLKLAILMHDCGKAFTRKEELIME